MEQAVALVQREVARYPRPPKAGDFPGFKSSKQRRWFFWAMQNGKITVPYRRTGTLGKSWTTEVHSLASDLQGIVGNVRPYAPYVQDDERQAAIHKGRWGTVQDAVRRKANEVINLFKQEIARIING